MLAAALLACQLASADHKNHLYKEGEGVVLYANKVGPFHNPRYARHCLKIMCNERAHLPTRVTVIKPHAALVVDAFQ